MRIKIRARQALPHPRPGEYLTFAGLMLTTFCGVTSASRALAKPLGYLLLGAFVLALCRQVWRLAGRPVHPDAAGAYLKEKLDFLKAGGLNLYRER